MKLRSMWVVRCAVVLTVIMPLAQAELMMPDIFANHMVLQQKVEAPVWGVAEPGATITVKAGGNTVKGKADADGMWQVQLPELPAPGPYTLSIKETGGTKVEIIDVLVGEVWICSGQSNMQWSVKVTKDIDLERMAANYPQIREFAVQRLVKGEPQFNAPGAWAVCSPATVENFTSVGYFFGKELHNVLQVPIGLIHSSWGGTPAESWTTIETLSTTEEFKPIVTKWEETLANYPKALEHHQAQLKKWEEKVSEAKAAGKPAPRQPGAPRGPEHPWRAAGLYNAMIHPLIPYAFQGAIWYQGESNAGRAWQYRTLFPAMITDWQKAWGRDFPFLFVQLADFTQELPEPGDSEWAELREAQTMALSVPNSGMAVIIDAGEANDIHPRDKQVVGRRLARNALANTYGMDLAYSGPMYKAMTVANGKATITFDHTNNGLRTVEGEPVKGFAIAGEDQQFVWADAVINGQTVVVSSPKVPNPVAVRYGWAHNPVCNLYNGIRLPASPFRTDDWPCITKNNLIP